MLPDVVWVGLLGLVLARAQDISTVTIDPSTGYPVWYRTLTVSRSSGFPPFSTVVQVGGLLSNASAPLNATANASFVPPQEFQDRRVPSDDAIPRIVFAADYNAATEPPITCESLHRENVLEDTWSGVVVIRRTMTLAVVGCRGLVPVTPVHLVPLRADTFVGFLPLLITWCTGVGIGSAVALVLSVTLRRGLVPVYDAKAQVAFLARVAVAPLYAFLLIDMWRGNGGWVPNAFLGVYSAAAAVVVVVGQLWVHPSRIAAKDALTAPAVEGWAWAHRFWCILVAAGGAAGAHVMAVLWSGLLGLRAFSAPAGVWRRPVLMELSLITALFMDGAAVAAAVFTVYRDEADVAVPAIAWPVAIAGIGAILLQFVLGLAAPLAADEAAVAARVTSLQAMRKEVQWLRRKEKEREAAERMAERERARLAASGGAVDAERDGEDGRTTVVRKVGVAPPSARLGSARPPTAGGVHGRAMPAVLVEAEEAGLGGLEVEEAAGMGLMLDEKGGYMGVNKPIPKVAGVRRDAVMFMRATGGAAASAIPGVARGPSSTARVQPLNGALESARSTMDSSLGMQEGFLKQGVWGGNDSMQVVGRPVTPPDVRRRRERRQAKRAAKERRRDERRRRRREAALGNLSARMSDSARSSARNGGMTARSRDTSRDQSATGRDGGTTGRRSSMGSDATPLTGRSDFTTGGLIATSRTRASVTSMAVRGGGGRLKLAGSAASSSTSRTGTRRSAVTVPPLLQEEEEQGTQQHGRADAGNGSHRAGGRPTGKPMRSAAASAAAAARRARREQTGTVPAHTPTSPPAPSPTRDVTATQPSEAAAVDERGALGSLRGRDSSPRATSTHRTTGRSAAVSSNRVSSHASPQSSSQRAEADTDGVSPATVAAARRSRRVEQSQRQLLQRGAAGALDGRLLAVPSGRISTTSRRFLTGAPFGGAGGRGGGRDGHWASDKPSGTGPSLGVAPNAAPTDANEARVRILRQNLQMQDGLI